jgi:uncharacterized membrane protein
MTAASGASVAQRSEEVDRNLALLAYGLMFFAIFFAGAPALVAVAIAYARRGDADPSLRSHFGFLISIFWVGFALTLLAGLSGLAAVLFVIGEVIRGVAAGQWDGFDAVVFSQMHVGVVVLFIAAAIVLGVLTAAWLMIASAYGFIRLASRRSISQTVG